MSVSYNSLSETHKKALSYMGAVRPNVRMVAIEVLLACQQAGYTLKTVWGYNPASRPEHSAGTALDFMVHSNRAAGDFITDYLWKHRARLGVRWMIWRQRIRSTSPGKPGTWQWMADRGSVTQNHMDHPHVNFHVKNYVPPKAGSLPVSKAPAPSTGGAKVTKYRVNTRSVALNGRSGPGTRYPVTMTAAKGYVLSIVEIRNGWARSTGGHWYSMQYLTPVGSTSASTSKVPPFPKGLRPGSSNPSAIPLQRQLKKAGFMSKSVKESANYGPRTMESVARFHNKHKQFRSTGVTSDPAIGPKGWAFLFANY